MFQDYSFSGDGSIRFDDNRTVKELIQYAFNLFDYYEPLGIEYVTVFQPYHSQTSDGWFTTDTSKKCAEEIENRSNLCFAYYMPDVFYFAEGGWGHHMPTLGNHPTLENPVTISIRFEDFRNSIVIAGKYSFKDVIRLLVKTGYIDNTAHHLRINSMNPYRDPYVIDSSDSILSKPLIEFEKSLPDSVVYIDIV